jgi:hypothetical protein
MAMPSRTRMTTMVKLQAARMIMAAIPRPEISAEAGSGVTVGEGPGEVAGL